MSSRLCMTRATGVSAPARARATRRAAPAARAPRPRARPARPTLAPAAAAPRQQPDAMPRWESIYGALTAKHGLTVSTPPPEAARLVSAGTHVLVDVRPPDVSEKASPAGAVKIPLYVKFNPAAGAGGGPGAFFKAALLALNGVQPTVQNAAFVEEVVAAAQGRAVCVLCETGGSLTPTPSFALGKPSRSLQAAFRLLEDGRVPAVLHVDGGAFAWNAAGLPFEGQYDGKEAGRTPGVVQDRK